MIRNLALLGVVTTVLVGYASRSSAAGIWDADASTSLGPTTMGPQVEGYTYGMGALQEDSLTLGTATALAMARTTADHLQARASASYPSLTPEAPFGISARSHSRFRDTFHLDLPEDFSGNSQLRLSFEFDGELSGNASIQLVIMDGEFHVSIFHTLNGIVNDPLGVFGSATVGAASFETSFDHVVWLGDQEAPSPTILYELIANVNADLNNPESISEFAQNSLRLTGVFIEDDFGALIPGATFTTDSGFNYPVPEPGGVSMAGLAACGLLVVAGRRRVRRV